jgi:hypothetical protein
LTGRRTTKIRALNSDPGTASNCSRRQRAAPLFDFVLFGGTGDLAMRPLLPAP